MINSKHNKQRIHRDGEKKRKIKRKARNGKYPEIG